MREPEYRMTLPESTSRYAIAFWSGEFADPATEQRFREHVAVSMARQLRVALAVWAGLLLLFLFVDYAVLGLTPYFYLCLLARLLTLLGMAICAALVTRRPQLATDGTVLTPLLLLAFSLFFVWYFILPRESIQWLIAATMAMLISLFVLLPNRVVLSALVALYAIIGCALCTHLVLGTSGLRLVVLMALLVLPTSAGLSAAYRFQVIHRREFAALERARRELHQRQRLEDELKRQATTDPLTGLFNRRHYEALFEREVRRARRYNRPLALCVLDLDYFKRINDSYGHSAGDTALTVCADVCRAVLRDSDIAGRLGGEEFIILLPDTDVAGATRVAERLRVLLASTDVVARQQRFRLTATIGVTELRPEDQSINDLILRADQALYEGKRAGRNRVCAATG